MAEHSPRPPSLLAQPSYLASQVSKYGRRRLEVALGEHGLLLGHEAVLSALDDFGPLSQQQLADSLDFDKSHLVSRIDDLAGRGLVTRTQDPDDRRRNKVTLTAAGQGAGGPGCDPSRSRPSGDSSTRCRRPSSRRSSSLLQRVLVANDAARRGGR